MKGIGIGAVVVAMIAVCASPAWGAFPGRDGDLVVATASGLELVVPATGAATPICRDVVLCGHPARPSFSPNGRAIAFVDTTSHRPVVLAADGSCLWCLLGTALTGATGSAAAFTADGGAMTVAGNGLWRVDLAVGGGLRVVRGSVSNAVWSSRGLLALVRAGWVWVGRPGHGKLRRLARGDSPSFSPDGARLAFARGGAVWTVPVSGGVRRRLVAGGAPAWSPSGGRIAYIAPRGAVEIIAASGGRPHTVGSVDGTALDWQPLPTSPRPACKLPAHATVLASDAEAVLFSHPRPSDGDTIVYGCLKALGSTHALLDKNNLGFFSGLLAVRLAGRFAALELGGADQYGDAEQKATLYDLSNGAAGLLADISWDYNAGGIVPGLDSLALDSSGFAAWRQTSSPTPESVADLSCPTASLCVAGDRAGNIVSSTNPTGGSTAWDIAAASPNHVIYSISCPSISLCVAVDSAGNILTSTDPTGGASAWTHATVPGIGGLYAVSCPSVSLCVAGGGATILTSTNPTGGTTAWTSATLSGGDGILGVSCPSVSLCVAISGGNPYASVSPTVYTSTNPTGGASTWTKATVPGIGYLYAVSCPSVSLCVAGGSDTADYSNGSIITTTNPTGGASAWTKTMMDQGMTYNQVSLSALSCPIASLCVATDNLGNILTSTDPTGGTSTWTKTSVAPYLGAVLCPSVSLCIASDADGNILTSTDPTGGANTWTSAAVDIPGCAPQSRPCESARLYARDDRGTRTVDTAAPGATTSISNVALAGDSHVLTWTHDGGPQQLELR
jgi:hypothetical protein